MNLERIFENVLREAELVSIEVEVACDKDDPDDLKDLMKPLNRLNINCEFIGKSPHGNDIAKLTGTKRSLWYWWKKEFWQGSGIEDDRINFENALKGIHDFQSIINYSDWEEYKDSDI